MHALPCAPWFSRRAKQPLCHKRRSSARESGWVRSDSRAANRRRAACAAIGEGAAARGVAIGSEAPASACVAAARASPAASACVGTSSAPAASGVAAASPAAALPEAASACTAAVPPAPRAPAGRAQRASPWSSPHVTVFCALSSQTVVRPSSSSDDS